MRKVGERKSEIATLQFLAILFLTLICFYPTQGAEEIIDKAKSNKNSQKEIKTLPAHYHIVPIIEVLEDPFSGESPGMEQSVEPSEKIDTEVIKPGDVITLKKGVDLVLKHSLQLKIASERIDRAIAKYEQVKSARNPKLDLQGSAMLRGPSESLKIPPPFDFRVYFSRNYNYLGRISLQYLITTFGNIENKQAASLINVQAQRENFESEKNEMAYQAKKSLYDILQAQSLVETARDYVDSSKDHLRVTKVLYREGIVSRYDVSRAKLAVSEAEKQLTEALKENSLARSYFLLLINQSSKVNFFVKPPEIYHINTSLDFFETLKEAAMKNRSQIKALKKNVEASETLLKAARASKNPTLAITGTYDRQTGTIVIGDYNWHVGLNLQIPIVDGGETRAKISEAESVVRTAKLALEQLRDQVSLEVEKARLDVIEAEINVKTAIRDVKTAREGYRMAKARYLNGLSTSVEIEDSMKTLNRKRRQLVDAQYQYNLALAALEKAINLPLIELVRITDSGEDQIEKRR